MEKAGLENLCWCCSGHEVGRCKYRIAVTKFWYGEACTGRMESTEDVLEKEENPLF